jgi:ABC-type nitrate/sulfonate/bicarbonate transport system substrate-binding protein
MEVINRSYIRTVLVLALSFFALAPAKAQETTMLVAYGGLAGYQLPLWFGAEKKVFDRYGVRVIPVFIPSGSNSVKALISGDVQATQTSGSGTINAVINGADLAIIAISLNVLPYNFIGAKGIEKPEDLKGKKIGVLNFGGVTDYATTMTLKRWALDSHRDVTVLQVGNDPTRLAALVSGSIQGTVLAYPALVKAENFGLKTLANLVELGIKYPANAVTVKRAWLRENRNVVERFLKGFVASIHSMKNQEEESIRILAKYTRIEDRESLVKTVRYFNAATPRVPRVDPGGIEAVLGTLEKSLPGISRRPANDFVDYAPLNAVERSGFIEGLYR